MLPRGVTLPSVSTIFLGIPVGVSQSAGDIENCFPPSLTDVDAFSKLFNEETATRLSTSLINALLASADWRAGESISGGKNPCHDVRTHGQRVDYIHNY